MKLPNLLAKQPVSYTGGDEAGGDEEKSTDFSASWNPRKVASED